MCGISGFIGWGNKDVGEKMIACIKHRGPDFKTTYQRDNLCFGHARLSIIDTSSCANQPMLNKEQSIALTFNGEIYNYIELRNMLQNQYHREFTTQSDTEVLLQLYEVFGINLLDKINGMFAFAIYNFNTKQLFIARDRMGKKPLYYTHLEKTFIFASEISAIIAHPLVPKELNFDAINQYLTFDYIPTPHSLYKNIFKLEPAHYILFQDNQIIKERYWHYQFDQNRSITFNDAISTLDSLLNKATKSRLMSDVPLGVFLSGGLDSSTIAYYAQKNTNQKIKTFSIGFNEKSYDEKEYAQQVANHLHTDHHFSILTPQKTLQLIDEVFAKLDEPFADASIIPTYYLSQFTRQQVTVALGGDGSDELLAGYPTFLSDKTKFLLQYLPPNIIQLLIKISSVVLKPSDKNISLDFKINQYLRGFCGNRNEIHQLWLGSFLPTEKKALWLPAIYEQLNDKRGMHSISLHFNEAHSINSHWHRIIYYYCQTYLLDDILFKVDRASMYNSLEVRAPFLDREVVEFINTLPREYKLKGWNGKYILKSLMKDKLPPHIINRPKKGFGIPLSKWIKDDLKNEIKSVLLHTDSIFEKKIIDKILQEHLNGRKNNRKLIWNLYCLKRVLLA